MSTWQLIGGVSKQRVLRWRNSTTRKLFCFAKDTGCNTAPLHEFLETLPFLEGKTFQVAAWPKMTVVLVAELKAYMSNRNTDDQ